MNFGESRRTHSLAKIKKALCNPAGLAGLLCALLLSGKAQTAPDARLSGRVIFPAANSGPATILFLRADRKAGASSTARYPRLPRPKQTDARDYFNFESLDEGWLYYVTIVAPGCRPVSLDRVDPLAGSLTVHLDAANPTNAPDNTVLRGRALDAHRNPIAGALVRIQEVTRNGTMHFSHEDLDLDSVSDEKGNFVVYGQTPFKEAGGAIQARDFATGLFEGWAPGETNHELILIEGGCLRGRLLSNGKPIANAEIGVDGFGTEAGSWMWSTSAFTDDEGQFLFTHLPSNRTCRLHGITGALGDLGAVPTQRAEVHGNGTTNDIGDINLEPTFKIDGQVRLSDGQSIPTNSILYFGNFNLGMSSPSAIANDGTFHLTGLPAGVSTIYLRVTGYQLTPRDATLIGGTLTNITVVSNLTDFVVDLHPRTRPAP